MLGLPDAISAGLFDLDGVLTRTATVHAAAWKETFDEFLRRRADELDGAGGRLRRLPGRGGPAGFSPRLPPGISRLAFNVRYRRRNLRVTSIPAQPDRPRPRQPSGREPARRIPPG